MDYGVPSEYRALDNALPALTKYTGATPRGKQEKKIFCFPQDSCTAEKPVGVFADYTTLHF